MSTFPGVTKRSNNAWRAQIRRKGYRHMSKDFPTFREAVAWKRQIETEMERGEFVQVDRHSQQMTLGQLIDLYIETRSQNRRKESSRKPEISRLRAFQRREPFLCQLSIHMLTPSHFREYRELRLTQTVSRGDPHGRGRSTKATGLVKANTVNKELNLLRSVLSLGVREHGLARNVASSEFVDRIAYCDERCVKVEDDELDQLITQCESSRTPWLSAALRLCLVLGLRRGEVLNLKWGDITISESDSYAVLRDTKNSRSPNRIRNDEIILTPVAVQILTNLPGERSGKVIKASEAAIISAFKRARVKANVRDFRFHDARHLFAISRIKAGVPEMFVRQQGRWRDHQSFRRYTLVNTRALAGIFAQYEDAPTYSWLGIADQPGSA